MNQKKNSHDLFLVLNSIHTLDYPAWIFNEKTLKIVDANQSAIEFCQYEKHELIGLSITDLWHNEDLAGILNDIDLHSAERSFFGNFKHRLKNGEIVTMRVRAVRLKSPDSCWEVHMVTKK